MSWARIEARTYEEALALMDKLGPVPSTLVQDGDHHWSLYVSADASEVPLAIYGAGVDPDRVSLFERLEDLPSAELQRIAEAKLKD
ncbi:MAG: hypothetical protein ACJ76I_06620 [Gaiellaceae bacterium]